MKSRFLLVMAFLMIFFIANAQTVTIDIQQSGGACMLVSDCQTNIACFDLIITIDEPDWEFASYNIWTEYPAPPVMSYSNDNACLTQNGGDTDNNTAGQYRVSGINGLTLLQPNIPTVFHSICYSYPNENTIQDSVIASGGTLNLYGFPFYSTITLVKHNNGNTVGITIPVQKFLTLNGSTFSCIISELTVDKVLTSNADGDGSNSITVGDVLTYTVTATNPGNITQHNVVVNDPKLSPSTQTCTAIENNETCVLVGTYTVTQADVDAGEIINTASVISNEEGPFTIELTTPVPQEPELTVVKTLITDVSGGISVGDVLSYSVVATNTGNLTLHNVVVSDPKLTPNSTTCATLAPGASCTLNGIHMVTQTEMNAGQIVNTGSGDSDETTPVTDQVITPLDRQPEITTVKTLLTDISGGVVVGDILFYMVEATNTGNVTLNNVVVGDPMILPKTKTCPSVAPGSSCSLIGYYFVKQSDLDAGLITNTGTGDSDETPPDTDQITTPMPQNPDITIEKTLLTNVSGGVSLNDVLAYSIVVTNTGNITLHNVVITDPILTPGSSNTATLAPGATCSLSGTHTVSQADVDAGYVLNTATADADEVSPETDQVNVPITQNPEITTVKTLLTDISGGVNAGDIFTYSVVVTNTGNVTLHNVTVSDPKLTPNSASCATLAPNQACTLTGTYLVTLADIDAGQIENTGTGDSDETSPDTDQVFTPVNPDPEITTVKTLLTDISGGVEAGDVFTYSVVVTNTGNVTLHNVTVSDPKLTPNSASCATLAPNHACTLLGTYTVTLADMDAGQIVNIGTGDSDETDPDPDQITTPLTQEPEITTVKTLLTDISGGVEAGDVFTYTVVVTNTGNVTLHNVTVSDPKLTPNTTSCATLAPGSSCTLNGIYMVTQANLNAGQVENTGVGDSDETTPVPDQLITPLVQTPEITTVKTLITDVSTGISVGDILFYQVEVTNTGNITLHNVTVNDTKLTPNNKTCPTINPLSTCTLSGFYIVTQADVDAGQIVNTGTGDSDETGPDPDQIITPIPQYPELTTVKTLLTDISGGVEVGDIFNYSVVVTNSGNVTLHNVTVSDPKLTPNSSSCAVLAPNQSCTLTGNYIVTQTDVDAGQIVNTATGDSDESDPEPDQVITPIPQNPELTTAKTLLTNISGGVSPGDVFTYSVVVTNTGNVTLHNVTVSDPKLTPNAANCASLAPNQTCTLTGTYTVTLADMSAGQIVNTGTGDSDEDGPDPDQITTPITPVPIVANDDDATGTPVNGYDGGTAVNNVLDNDLLDGNPVTPTEVTISAITDPADGVTLNILTGEVTVDPQTPAGTYTIVYQICEVLNPTNCDQATITVEVSEAAIVANDDDATGTPVNGYDGGTAVNNVLDNDLLDGDPVIPAEVIISAITDPSDGVTLNVLTGEVTVDPQTPAGTYTIVYQICEVLNPTNCDQATITVEVAETAIVANDDDATGTPVNGYDGGTAVNNVLDNDLLNGDPVIPSEVTISAITDPADGVTLNILTGEVTVDPQTPAGTYTIIYQICEILNPTNCDQATITVEVSEAAIVANDDNAGAVTIAGGTNVMNVFDNDLLNGSAVNPSEVSLSVTIPDPDGVLILNTDGSVDVVPNSMAGIYQLTYQICEIINPANCDQAVVTAQVLPSLIVDSISSYCHLDAPYLYFNLVAENFVFPGNVTITWLDDNDDVILVQNYAALTGSVLFPGAAIDGNGYGIEWPGWVFTGGQWIQTDDGFQDVRPVAKIEFSVNPTIIAFVDYPPATSDCAAFPNMPVALDDSETLDNGIAGALNILNVLNNDVVGGMAILPSGAIVTTVTPDPGNFISLNPDGSVDVAPGTPEGVYTLTYSVCLVQNPNNCDQATVTITVGAAEIIANDDTGNTINGYSGGQALVNVLTNDLLNNVTVNPADIQISQISTTNPGVTLNALTGAVNVAAGTPEGTYYLVYEICEILNPTNCDQATVTVEVSAAPIVANDDDASGTPVNGYDGGTAVNNVLDNDLLNGNAVIPTEVIISAITDPADGVTLNILTGEVTVDPQTPAGTYTIVYQICEVLNPTNCDQATITVEVSETAIVANDDDATGTPVNGYDGGTAVNNVLDNDLLNGDPVIPAEVIISAITDPADGVTLNILTGEVTVDPQTPAGTYTIVYQICEILNPTNCDQATITVEVSEAAIVANDDDATGTPVNGYDGGVAVNNVLDNDLLNGDPVIPAEVTISAITDPADGVTLNIITGEVTVDPQTPAGTYTIVYQICEIINPTNCDQATITVEVSEAVIVANDDDATSSPVNGYYGGIAVSNVLSNDLLNSDPVIPAEVAITAINDPADGVTLNTTTGQVNVSAGTPAGTYTIVYQICEVINPANCDDATITVEVTFANIFANDDDATGTPVNGYDGGTAVNNVLDNDLLNGSQVIPAEVTLTAISDPADGVTLNIATGEVTVDAGTPAGTYTIDYQICEVINPTNCDQAVITVEVSAAIIVANNDDGGPVNSAFGGVAVPDVLVNDLLNGVVVIPTEVTITAINDPADGVTLNIATGEVTVVPGTPAGTYTIVYQICEVLNPANCDQATISVEVISNNQPVTVNEHINTCEGTLYQGDVLANGDYDPDATALFVNVVPVKDPLHGNFSIQTDGTFEYTPFPGYDGDDMIVVSVCDNGTPLPSVCSNDTIFVVVTKTSVVDLGADQTICAGTDPQIEGTATEYIGLFWTSNGDGAFSDNTILNPVYVPGAADIAAGIVELCLTAQPNLPCAIQISDCKNLEINKIPDVFAGADGSICSNQTYPTNPTITNNSEIFWVSSGDGYFDDELSANTIYNPGPTDISLGSVELCVYATAILPCTGQVSDCITLVIDPSPEANSGQDATICIGETYQLNGSAANIGAIHWTTSGNGTFSSTSSLTPVYTPGSADLSAGFAELCLEVSGSGGCTLVTATSCLTLTIYQVPEINGLQSQRTLACADYDFNNSIWFPIDLDVDVFNYSSVAWTTNGDGYFDNPSSLSPKYYPGLHDSWDGAVTLCINANGLGSCLFVASECIEIILPIQIITVTNPGWNGISSYVDKSTTLVPDVMAPVEEELIIMINKQGLEYWPVPDPPINQLGNWEPIGYKSKFAAQACLPIYGDTLKAQSFIVNGAFTYLPVLTNVPTSVSALLGANASKVMLIYDWPTGEVWTNVAAGFTVLYPGKAYLLVNKSSSSNYTVNFPDFNPNLPIHNIIAGPISQSRNNSPWNNVTNTAKPHFILFADEAIAALATGDIIGSFDKSGNCVGMAEFENNGNLFKLVAMGNEPVTSEDEGYENGELMKYRLYRQSTGETFDISLSYSPEYPSSDGLFSANSVSFAERITMNITSVNALENEFMVKLSPNPATDVLEVNSDFEIRTITLLNNVGQKVMSRTETSNRFLINVSSYSPGMYFLKLETKKGNIITKRVTIQ